MSRSPKFVSVELVVEKMRVAAEALEHRLRDRLEQLLMGEDELAELPLVVGLRPIILRPERAVPLLRNVESAPAPHPALDEVGMDVAGLLDREITLVDRAMAISPEAHLLGQAGSI